MKITAAVVKQKEGDFILEEIDLDEPRDNEVLIRIVATGTCHTDMTSRDGIMGPGWPVVLGHEGAGVIERVGKLVTKVEVGDHVVLTYGFCGKCINCLKGAPAYCYNFGALNFGGSRLDGTHSHHHDGEVVLDNYFSQSSFATYTVAVENNIVKVPKEVPLELLGPLGCGIQTGAGAVMNALRPEAGSSIAVSGIGAVGLSGLMAAKAIGCTTIVAVDINDERLQLAKELGATHVINSLHNHYSDFVHKLIPEGLEYVFDTTGRDDVINEGIKALRPNGTIGLVGVASKPLTIEMNDFVGRGIKLKGIVEGESIPDSFIPSLIALYQAGRFPFDKLIKKYKFEDINQAISDSENGKTIKPVILVGEYNS